MEHKVLRKAEKLQKSHTKKQRLYRGLSVLAAGVVFCTTYALILPAITLDNRAICGMEEHEHTDECYTATGSWRCMDEGETYTMLMEADYVAHVHAESCTTEDGTIVCPLAQWPNVVEPHEHTDECYRLTPHVHGENCMVLVQGELICTEPISEGHRHGEECMGEEPMLTCTLPEHEFHTDDCYDSNGNIICGMENHVHDVESCYTLTPVLVCGLDESEGHPTHGDTCYAYVTAPGCGIEEGTQTMELVCEKPALHTHTDECYTDGELTCERPVVLLHEHTDCYVPGEAVLTCGLDEHEHKDECYETTPDPTILGNGTADSAMPTADFELTGKWADDLVTVAQSQGGKVSANYGAWYTETYGEAADNAQAFVSWCLDFLAIPETTIPQTGTVNDFVEQAEFCGILRTGIYYANVGDIVVHMSEYGNVQSGIAYYNEETGTYGVIGVQEDVVTTLDWNFEDIVAWVCIEDVQPKTEDPDEPIEETEYLLEEDKWDPVAWQALIDSGWFTYWEDKIKEEDHPTLLDEEISIDGEQQAETSTIINSQQIEKDGGYDKDENVEISKTVAGTDKENVFDITLTVKTTTDIKTFVTEPDMAVILIMDISNTMKSNMRDDNDVLKYTAALEAAENFVCQFVGATPGSELSKIGVVAFNSNSYEICPLTSVADIDLDTYRNQIRVGTGNIINADGYQDSHSKFTNMEAGLQRAYDMLKEAKNKHQFVIFLTDGLPTTYTKSDYNGYDTFYTEKGEAGTDGVFVDVYTNKYCSSGTNYSDKGARKAADVASIMKSKGIKIYSIGVGLTTFGAFECKDELETQKTWKRNQQLGGWEYILNQICRARVYGQANTIDRDKKTTENSFESERMKGLAIYYAANPDRSFENWLENTIGSGFYADCNDKITLEKKFTDIFDDIKRITLETMADAWKVSDPMGDGIKFVDYISDKDTYALSLDDETLNWDLRKSAYTYDEESKTYSYEVNYTVRLMNEESDFKKESPYATNGTTALTYRYIEEENGQQIISEERKINFPIPEVKGYLGELTFDKKDNYGNAVSGATFLLYHNADCELCRLNDAERAKVEPTDSSGEYVTVAGYMVYIATSGEDGKVSFDNIPSGHRYTLVETVVPDGYYKGNETYNVAVQFGNTTVTVTNADGTAIGWDTKNPAIINHTSVELPATGGVGVKRYVGVGVVLMTTSVLWYAVRRKQRE